MSQLLEVVGIDISSRIRSLQLVMPPLKKPALLALVGATVLLEQLERPLASLVALAGQELQGLLAGSHLLAADDAAVLVLDEVLLGQTTGSVLGSAVEHLSLRANSDHLRHLILYAGI